MRRLPTPRNSSVRNPDRKTLGPKVAKLAEFLGAPLLPWQRYAFDIALELDNNGRLFYDEVFISVPRQCGKTAGAMRVNLHRTITCPDARLWYTAQTGAAAREHWLQELGILAEQKLGKIVQVKRGAGDTRLVVPTTMAQSRPMPPTAAYLHGKQSDMVFIDEAWALSEQEGSALLQAVLPTFNTRVNLGLGTQLWYLSTKGTADSTWYHNKLDQAIDEIAPTSRKCVVDFGIRDDVDPTDLPAVIAAHPGVQGGLIAENVVYKAAESMSPAEFARAFGNISTKAFNPVFKSEDIESHTTEVPFDDDSPIHLGVAVAFDKSCAAIVAAGYIGDTPALEVITARPGTSWVVQILKMVDEISHPEMIVIDDHGPAAWIAEEIQNSMASKLRIAKAEDLIMGTEALLAGIAGDEKPVLLRANPELADELSAVRLRVLGDRGRLISRTQSPVPIPRVEAGILALRSLQEAKPPEPPAPQIWSFL